MTNPSYRHISEKLVASLSLPTTPIAVAFSDSAPAGIAQFDGVAPAGCSFWQLAADGGFTTTAKDHELCAIGVHTHNLDGASASQSVELGDSLKAMMGLDYVREDEVAGIPVMQKSSKHVTYVPLEQAPESLAVDVVLLFADAVQGLVITESLARVDQGHPVAMGRPACAVIPMSLNQNAASVSLGCCGARAYLEQFADGVALWALPGAKLEQYCESIETLANANKVLTEFHTKRGTDVAAGKRPTVKASLEAL